MASFTGLKTAASWALPIFKSNPMALSIVESRIRPPRLLAYHVSGSGLRRWQDKQIRVPRFYQGQPPGTRPSSRVFPVGGGYRKCTNKSFLLCWQCVHRPCHVTIAGVGSIIVNRFVEYELLSNMIITKYGLLKFIVKCICRLAYNKSHWIG